LFEIEPGGNCYEPFFPITGDLEKMSLGLEIPLVSTGLSKTSKQLWHEN